MLDKASTELAEKASPRVLFVTRKWAPAIGGMETYSLKLVEHVAPHQDVDVIALEGRSNRRPPHAIALLLFPFQVLRQWLALQHKPNIVHLGDLAIWPLALFAMLLAPQATIVISAHGTDISYASRSTLLGRLYRLYQTIGTRFLSKAVIIANSRATASACSQIGWKKVRICPLATDLASPETAKVQDNTILFAGRLIRQKGLAWFVDDVLPLLDPKLHIAVAGLVVDESEAKVLDDPRVTFLGALPPNELAQRYAEALCVVVPNIDLEDGSFEGFGLVAPEAASAGGIVLAARIGGLPDAVIDGKTGFLIEAGDPTAWSTKIAEIAGWTTARREDFISVSKVSAAAHFSWDRVASQTSEIYRQCA